MPPPSSLAVAVAVAVAAAAAAAASRRAARRRSRREAAEGGAKKAAAGSGSTRPNMSASRGSSTSAVRRTARPSGTEVAGGRAAVIPTTRHGMRDMPTRDPNRRACFVSAQGASRSLDGGTCVASCHPIPLLPVLRTATRMSAPPSHHACAPLDKRRCSSHFEVGSATYWCHSTTKPPRYPRPPYPQKRYWTTSKYTSEPRPRFVQTERHREELSCERKLSLGECVSAPLDKRLADHERAPLLTSILLSHHTTSTESHWLTVFR